MVCGASGLGGDGKCRERRIKRRPKALVDAVSLLSSNTTDGWVGLGSLGQYMKRTDPSFAPKVYGHSTLSAMVQCYPELAFSQDEKTGPWVGLKASA